MTDREILAVTTEDGRHLLAMPDGTLIPGVSLTRFKQDPQMARNSACEAFVVFALCRVITESKLKEIQSLNTK